MSLWLRQCHGGCTFVNAKTFVLSTGLLCFAKTLHGSNGLELATCRILISCVWSMRYLLEYFDRAIRLPQVVSILNELRQSMDYQKYLMRNFTYQMFFEVLTPYQFIYILVGGSLNAAAALMAHRAFRDKGTFGHHVHHTCTLRQPRGSCICQLVPGWQPDHWWTCNSSTMLPPY